MMNMNKEKEYKAKQIRRTLEDTINFQNELSELVEKKKLENMNLFTNEKKRFRYIFPKAILSQGNYEIDYVNEDGRHSRFRHLPMFAWQMRQLSSPIAILIDNQSGVKYEVMIQDLWAFFEYQLEIVYPFAREEATHMSAEAPAREAPSAYEFSAKNE